MTSLPPIDKSFVGALRDVVNRVTLLERRTSKAGVQWSQVNGKPFASIVHGVGVAQWVRIGWVDGVNSSNGASLEMSFGTGGNFGGKERQTGRIHFAERNDAIQLEVISDLPLPPSGPTLWYTKKIRPYVYELWAGLAVFNVPLTVQVVNTFPLMPHPRVNFTMDMITTTIPSGLTAVTPKVLLRPEMEPGGALVTDWNQATTAGFYSGGTGAANGPGEPTQSWVGIVRVSGQSGRIVQDLSDPTTNQDAQVKSYRRMYANAAWGPWLPTHPAHEMATRTTSFAGVYASATTSLTAFHTLAIPASDWGMMWVISVAGQLGFNAAASSHGLSVTASAGSMTNSRLHGRVDADAPASKWASYSAIWRLNLSAGVASTVTFSGKSSIATGSNYAYLDIVATPSWVGAP